MNENETMKSSSLSGRDDAFIRGFFSSVEAWYVLSSFSEFVLTVFLQYPVAVFSEKKLNFIRLVIAPFCHKQLAVWWKTWRKRELNTRLISNFGMKAVRMLGRDVPDTVICCSIFKRMITISESVCRSLSEIKG